MDPTSAVRTDTLPAIASVVTPGAVASASYLWFTVKMAPTGKEFAESHEVACIVIAALAWIACGFVVESLGTYVEVYCIDRKRSDCDLMLQNWWWFLRTAWETEPIGLRYLRRVLVTFKFELNMFVAVLSAGPGLILLAIFGHLRWRILLLDMFVVLTVAALFFKAAWDSSSVLAKVRSELLRGLVEPPFDGKSPEEPAGEALPASPQPQEVLMTGPSHDPGTKWPRADKLQLVSIFVTALGTLITIASLWFVYYQLVLNNETNKVAIRGNLNDRQTATGNNMAEIQALSTLWTLIPNDIPTDQLAPSILRLATPDQDASNAKSAAALYHSMFDAAVFSNKSRAAATQDLRRMFLYTQDEFYLVQNIFDYKNEGIMSDGEWRVWKGTLREMHAHPMLLTVIWQGYQNHYFPRKFARFLQSEICPDQIPSDVADVEAFKRDRDFVRLFYPEMTKQDWPNALPDY